MSGRLQMGKAQKTMQGLKKPGIKRLDIIGRYPGGILPYPLY
jgi:hypothetical protein